MKIWKTRASKSNSFKFDSCNSPLTFIILRTKYLV
jgi:hypothetical protein